VRGATAISLRANLRRMEKAARLGCILGVVKVKVDVSSDVKRRLKEAEETKM
jgi:hypothetical protein